MIIPSVVIQLSCYCSDNGLSLQPNEIITYTDENDYGITHDLSAWGYL